jgi:hypothetical protein
LLGVTKELRIGTICRLPIFANLDGGFAWWLKHVAARTDDAAGRLAQCLCEDVVLESVAKDFGSLDELREHQRILYFDRLDSPEFAALANSVLAMRSSSMTYMALPRSGTRGTRPARRSRASTRTRNEMLGCLPRL